jgi:hypothetical protein
MIVFLNFKNIGEHEMGPPLNNVWHSWDSAGPCTPCYQRLPAGPKFASADWFTGPAEFSNTAHDYGSITYTPQGHRTETIDLDLPIKKQLRRINGIPIVLLLFPLYIHDLKDDNNTLSKIIKTFEPFPQVKFMFSNTWDMGAYSHKEFNAVDYILDSVKDIDSERLNFYLCNPHTVDAIKSKRPEVDARFMSVYFNRIRHFNQDIYKHNPEQRSKHFLCLNNLKKNHRTFIVDRLPPEHSYVSYVANGKNLSDGPLSQDVLPTWQDSLPHFYYDDSYINIVNETMHEYDTPQAIGMAGHSTEKSLKPIHFRQMFLVSGNIHANKLMQDLGFKLFDNFIDYSFDIEEDPLLRLKQLYVEIKRLTDIDVTDIHAYYNSEECQSIIEHNLAVYQTYCYNPTQELLNKYAVNYIQELTLI